MGHRAPARLGLGNCRFLLYLPPGAFIERRVRHALREGSAAGRCRHRRADIGAGDRRCEAPRSAGGSWTSKDAQRIEEAEKSALQARPGRKQGGGGGASPGLLPRLGGGDGYGRWNLESKEAWRERQSFSFAVLFDAIPSPMGRSGDQVPCLWWLNIVLRMQHAAWAAGL